MEKYMPLLSRNTQKQREELSGKTVKPKGRQPESEGFTIK